MKRVETNLWSKVQEILHTVVEATIYVDQTSGNWVIEFFPA